MSSTTKDKRIARIERRGTSELVAAMRKRLISVRTADSLFYLPAEEQRVQLQRRLQAAEQVQRRSRLVASVIRSYLESAERIDLQALRSLIQTALARASVGN
jgi:hypothetical protein